MPERPHESPSGNSLFFRNYRPESGLLTPAVAATTTAAATTPAAATAAVATASAAAATIFTRLGFVDRQGTTVVLFLVQRLMASRAALSSAISTKPKPLLRPVSRS